MKTLIEVIRLNKGCFYSGHVFAIITNYDPKNVVYAENANLEKIKVNKIKFDFGPNRANALEPLADDYSLPQDSSREHIYLESNVSFRNIILSLMNSKFNTSSQYSSLSNNCVHAILFALDVAGIKLKMNNNKKVKHLFCCFWANTSILTPRELCTYLISHQIEHQDSQYHPKSKGMMMSS